MALIQELQFCRGIEANLPGLAAGQPAWTTDTLEPWVGTNGTVAGNVRIIADMTPAPSMAGALAASRAAVRLTALSGALYAHLGG